MPSRLSKQSHTARIICIGDPHIRIRDKEIDDNYFTRVLCMIEEIIQICKKRKPDGIVILGDTLHENDKLSMSVRNRAIDFIRELTYIAPVLLLIGNHDRINNKDFLTENHPFYGMEFQPNLTIAWKPFIWLINNIKFIGVPYVEPGRFFEALNTLDKNEFEVENIESEETKRDDENQVETWKTVQSIFAHQEVEGVDHDGKGTISTIGDRWDDSYPFLVNGHIHIYQKLAENVVYVGTPIQHDHGQPDTCAISLFTYTEGIKIPDEERISLQTVTKLITLEMTAKEINSFTYTGKDQIRIKIIGDNAEVKSLFEKKIKELNNLGIIITKKNTGTRKTYEFLDLQNKNFNQLLYLQCDSSEKKLLLSVMKKYNITINFSI